MEMFNFGFLRPSKAEGVGTMATGAQPGTPQQQEAVRSIMDMMKKKRSPQQGGLMGGVQGLAGNMYGGGAQQPQPQGGLMGGLQNVGQNIYGGMQQPQPMSGAGLLQPLRAINPFRRR